MKQKLFLPYACMSNVYLPMSIIFFSNWSFCFRQRVSKTAHSVFLVYEDNIKCNQLFTFNKQTEVTRTFSIQLITNHFCKTVQFILLYFPILVFIPSWVQPTVFLFLFLFLLLITHHYSRLSSLVWVIIGLCRSRYCPATTSRRQIVWFKYLFWFHSASFLVPQ